ncbi:MAG: response regulator transcription factor [Candidatus Acidiferrum sp.]
MASGKETPDAKRKASWRRILIADDHEFVRMSLRSLLESGHDLKVCGEAKDGEEAVHMARELNPDLIILDVHMPVLDGISAAKQIKSILPNVPVLMHSMYHGQQMDQMSRVAGAQGFVCKTDTRRVLLNAVNTLLQGKTFFHEK